MKCGPLDHTVYRCCAIALSFKVEKIFFPSFFQPCRKNLDPTGKTTDNELWEALEISQVKGLVSELGGLGMYLLYK